MPNSQQQGVVNPYALNSPSIRNPYLDLQPETGGGSGGTLTALWGGAQQTYSALRNALNVYSGDNEGVLSQSMAAEGIPRTDAQMSFMSEIQERSGEADESLLDGIRNVAASAWNNPRGAFHEMAAQLPNSAVAMGGMYTGGKIGAGIGALTGPAAPVAVPVMTVVGGIIGMFGANTALETGFIAQEAAQDGEVTDEELSDARRQGAIKGGVITGIDAATLGLSRAIAGVPGRAVERAVSRTLVDNGIDVASDVAVRNALANPQILSAVTEAGAKALESTMMTGQRLGRNAVAFSMETASEGAGEYLGSLAAGLEASPTDAVMESLLSMPQSAGEMFVARGLVSPGTNTRIMQDVLNPAPKSDPLNDAITNANQAADNVRAQGGDALDVEIARANTEALTLPDAVRQTQAQMQAQADQLFGPPITAPRRPVTQPGTWSGADPVAAPSGSQTVAGEWSGGDQQAAPDSVRNESIDPLIAVASRAGDADAVTRLEAAKRMVSVADRFASEGNEQRAQVMRDRSQAIVDAMSQRLPEPVQQEPEQPKGRAVEHWTGRRGNGYETVEAAEAGMRTRQRRDSSLDWRVEQMESGRYQVVGYEQMIEPAGFTPPNDMITPAEFTPLRSAMNPEEAAAFDALEAEQQARLEADYDAALAQLSDQMTAEAAAETAKQEVIGRYTPEAAPPNPAMGNALLGAYLQSAQPEREAAPEDMAKPDAAPETADAAPETADAPVLQNRDRATQSSIEQMQRIASRPDYGLAGFSRMFSDGAPVVEPGVTVPSSNLGRSDTATTAEGRKIPVQYAVVEAGQLVPSHRADGTRVPEYEQASDGRSRAIAGNGRVAGIQRGFELGTTNEYVEAMIEDEALHGISADVIRAMDRPVLVRIMPQEEITANIGDESNTRTTASLTPAEQAKSDARRVDVDGITLSEDGEVTPQAVSEFIAAMPQSERAGLMDNGQPNRQAHDRLSNLLFRHAFDSDALLRLQAEATDPEVRTIMSALRLAAPKLARLRGQGVYDIRGLVEEAAEVAVNAKRAGEKLSDYIQQADISRSPEINPILQVMADNIRSAKRIGEHLTSLADLFYNESQRSETDMFGSVTRRSREQLMGEMYGDESGSANAQGDVIPARPVTDDAGAERTEAERGEPASAGQAEEGAASQQEVTPFGLESQTEQSAAADAAALADSQRAEAARVSRATDRAQADADRSDFRLSGSDTPSDVAASYGQSDMLSTAEQVDAAASEVDTDPTEGQKEAGNYRKGHVSIQGLDISIENPRDSIRSGTDPDGNRWESTMAHHYGYIKRSEGADGEQVDVFIGPNPDSDKVFVVDQVNPDGSFDEHKVMIGFDSRSAAQTGYRSNYQDGWTVGPITEMTMEEFRQWLESGNSFEPINARLRGQSDSRTSSGVEDAPVVYSGYEREASNIQGRQRDTGGVQGARPDAGRSAQFDLFAPPEADTRQAYADLFGTIVRPRTVDRVSSATDTISEESDLAHMLASIRKDPSETFYAVATDADGKVLRVMRHTRGTSNSSSVYPLDIVAEAASIDGIDSLHFAHNHPSGTVTPSNADTQITDIIQSMLDGTGIEPGYHVVIGKDRWGSVQSRLGLSGGPGGRLSPRARRKSIPVTERRFTKREKLGENITSPWAALEMVEGHDSAIFLLDTQHYPVAVIPMSPGEMAVLREGGRVNRILSAISTSNANSAIVKSQSREAADNVTRMLSSYGGDMRVLDAFYPSESGLLTSAAQGRNLADGGPFFSKQAGESGRVRIPIERAREIVSGIVANLDNAPEVFAVQSMQDEAVPEVVRREDARQRSQGASGEPEGFYYQGNAYIVLDGLSVRDGESDTQALFRVFAHEVLGHAGLRGLFRNNLDSILSEVAARRRGDVRRKAEEYGLDMANRDDRLTAAEEVLAEMAQSAPENSLVTKAVEAVRQALRRLYMSLPEGVRRTLDGRQFSEWVTGMSDAEIIDRLIVPAREFIRSGHEGVSAPGDVSASGAPVMSRSSGTISVDGADRPTTNSEGQPIHSTDDGIRNFWRWFGDSKVVDASGKPLVVYHGSPDARFIQEDGVFKSQNERWGMGEGGGAFWFAKDRSVANTYADDRRAFDYQRAEPDVIPGYLKLENPLIVDAGGKAWREAQSRGKTRDVIDEARENGNDGVIIRNVRDNYNSVESGRNERATDTYVVFDSTQIKSATDNTGAFDPASPDIRFIRSATSGSQRTTASAFSDLSADQQDFMRGIGRPGSTDRARSWVGESLERAGTKIRQGLVDRYAALKEMDEKLHGKSFIDTAITDSSWVLAKMSSAGSGALSAMMEAGRIAFDKNQKVITLQEGDASGGLVQVLSQLGSAAEVERFMGWIAANRSEKLAAEGRENLFSAKQIAAGKTLNTGTMENGESRERAYSRVFEEFQQYRDDVLAIAEATGIISSENRDLWRDEFYVPFYRVMEDDSPSGPIGSKGLSRQEAFKRLKGGSENLNDLLENTLMNFHHLLSAGLKNQAAVQVVSNARDLGIARRVPESRRDAKTSTFVLVNGNRVFYEISDPLVYEALTMLSDPGLNNFAVRAMSAFKRVFTQATTVTPQFIIANMLRDLGQASATSKVSYNPLKNAIQGAMAYNKSGIKYEMLASGASFSFGHVYGADASEVKASLNRSVKGAGLVDNARMVPGIIRAGWRQWNSLADVSENTARSATYQQNVEESGRLRAAFEARDIMDFSAHGSWPAIRFLVRVVPFLNARLQGLDKIYRAGVKPSIMVAMGEGTATDREAAGRFAAVTGALVLASLALYMANLDDEEYQKLEEWQKDTYWFFRVGDKGYFVPKPFEVGAIATLAERVAQQFLDDKATGDVFRERLQAMLTETFSFNPVPHMFQPALDIYANKDAFTGRDIETAGMERLSIGLRARDTTTAPARALSAASRAFGDESPVALSPVQADHLIRGYLGGVGASAAGMIDTFWRAGNGQEAPSKRWSEYQPIRRFYRDLGAPAPYTRYSTVFYDGLRESSRVYADVMELQHLGRLDEARSLAADNRQMMAMRRDLNRAQQTLSQINRRMQQVRRSDNSAEWKRQELDRLTTMRNRITEVAGKRIEDVRAQ